MPASMPPGMSCLVVGSSPRHVPSPTLTFRRMHACEDHETVGGPEQLSLSRLNHWLPGREAHPEVVQGTAQFHHEIADALLPQTDPVFDDATAFHTAVHVFDPEPAVVQRLVGCVLLPCQVLAAGFLGRHEDLYLRERERQEAQIL